MTEERNFCPQCFADGESGSWEHVVIGDHCTNCGAMGTVRLPVWAITSIRSQASWVGKRYYPNKEDLEIFQERADLLTLVKEFPGRTCKRSKDGDFWVVTQIMPDSHAVSNYSKEKDYADAIRNCGLRYVPADRLL